MTSIQAADTDTRPERLETDAGDAPASSATATRTLTVTRALGVYLSLATLVALLSAISIWPAVESVTNADGEATSAAAPVAGQAAEVVQVAIFPRVSVPFSPGQAVLVFALAMGAAGGGLAGLRALAEHRAAEDFKTSYTWWYVIRPLIGAGLAVIVYLILRAGLVGAAPTTVLNAFGVGSVAALSGLFAQNVLVRLNLVIEALFGSTVEDSQADSATR